MHGRLEGVHRVGDPRRGGGRPGARHRRGGRAPPPARRHGGGVPRARAPAPSTSTRSTPAPCSRRCCAARSRDRSTAGLRGRAGPPRRAHDRAARLRQHLRHRDDRGGAPPRSAMRAHLRPPRPPRPGHRRLERGDEPRRRLAGPARRATACPRRPAAWTTTSPTAPSPAAPPTRWTSTPPTPRSAPTACACCEDDRRYFPSYEVVLLYRGDLAARAPAAVAALERLEGRISRPRDGGAERARQAGSRPGVAGRGRLPGPGPHGRRRRGGRGPAEDLAARARGPRRRAHRAGRACRCWPLSRCAVPLGIVAARHPRLGQLVVGGAGLLQTIPSIALLVLLIPVLGIGSPPGDGGAVPLRPAADRAQHPRRAGRDPGAAAQLGAGPRAVRPARGCASSSCRWRCRRSSPASRPRR